MLTETNLICLSPSLHHIQMFECTISANSNQIAYLISSFELFCRNNTVNDTALNQTALVLEEIVSNAIKYGYPEAWTNGQIKVSAEIIQNTLYLTIINDGKAFNPTVFPKPDLDSSLDDRQIGGLGLHLISKLSDSVVYLRQNNKNIIEIRKRLDCDTPYHQIHLI